MKYLTLRPLLGLLCILFSSLSANAQEAANAVWVLPIEGEITAATTQYVRSRVEQANEAQPLALVFLIDTPGGQILAAENIVDTILQDVRVPSIAVVRNAISAGAIIAMSAEQLVMLPGSSIGAATAINGLTGQDAGEKINSAWRSFFRSTAETRGRNEEVAEGMVSERIEIPGLSTDEELITLSAAQAVEYNIADLQANTLDDALDELGYGGVQVETLEPNVAERLGGLLSNPLIAAALLVIGIGGILIELFSPGFGIPGIVGVLALAALAVGAFVATPAGALDLVLILGGVGLLVLELLVIPGFGLAGILGLGAIFLAVFRIFPNDWSQVLLWSSLFGTVLTFGLFWLLPNSRFAKVFALSTRLDNQPGVDREQGRLVASLDYLQGMTGVALTDLRPAGTARLDGQRVDVVTEGDFISNGTEIEVLRVEGVRVVVSAYGGSEV